MLNLVGPPNRNMCACDQAEDGYPVPNEEEYYQQRDPDGNGDVATGGNPAGSRRGNNRARSPSVQSQKMSKPMPKGSSFFIFSSKNRLAGPDARLSGD